MSEIVNHPEFENILAVSVGEVFHDFREAASSEDANVILHKLTYTILGRLGLDAPLNTSTEDYGCARRFAVEEYNYQLDIWFEENRYADA